MRISSVTVLGGLEIMSFCVFSIVLLFALMVGLPILAAYLAKKRDERKNSANRTEVE